MSELPIRGLDETLAVLAALPVKIQRQAVRQGLTAAAAVIRDEARARAPKKTGKMARAIRSGSARQEADGSFSISIRLTGTDHAFLGLFHEYGVRAHYISAGNATGFNRAGEVAALSPRLLNRAARDGGASDVATRALKIGNNFVSGAVLHPGHAARPFLRPALDVKADEAVQALAAKIKLVVEYLTGFRARAFGNDPECRVSGPAVARAVLVGDAGLTALVPAASIIADEIAPEGTALPFILVKHISGVDFRPITLGARVHTRKRVQVEIHARSAPERKAIKAAVRACALNNPFPVLAGYQKVTLHTDGEGPDFTAEDPFMRIGEQDLMITFSEAK